ncbi:hypothetical protein GW17_00031865 [Ensete ventricosum]|nr:hypothetical protein GW17_00031865 [Ensete ventricosum]
MRQFTQENQTNRQDGVRIHNHAKQIELLEAEALEVRARKDKPFLPLFLHPLGEHHRRRPRGPPDGGGHRRGGGGDQLRGVVRVCKGHGMERRVDSEDRRRVSARGRYGPKRRRVVESQKNGISMNEMKTCREAGIDAVEERVGRGDGGGQHRRQLGGV